MTLLHDAHRQMLVDGSAIAPALIQQRGYASLPQPEDLIDRGFSKAQAKTVPALGIPLWDVHGQQHGWQIRPDSPRQMQDGKVFRYEMPKGGRLILDVHPAVQPRLGDPQEPLWITEGVKKGDALASQGLCTIALIGGVWGFRGTNAHGGKVILPDWEYVALNDRLVYVAFDSDLATKANVQAALKALWALLRDRRARPSRVQWPDAYQREKWGVDDFLARGHTLAELQAMIPPLGLLPQVPPPAQRNGSHAAPGEPERPLPYSDYTNARAFVQDHGQNLRYCFPWKSWLVWVGTHWYRDEVGQVQQLAKQTIKRLARRVEQLDEAQAKDLLAHIKKSLSKASLDAMVRTAQDEPGIPIKPDAVDTDPWLLNCANGTLDLRTGILRPHQQADLLTKCLPIPYDPAALCPTWEHFLWRIMGGTLTPATADLSPGALEQRHVADIRAQALIDYLQRCAGYTLTGSTKEQCLFLCHGPTKTGKSTYLATMRNLLGPYGKQADMATFMHKDRPEVRNDLADLAGSRYVYAVESQEGKRLAEGLVKQMTGGVDHLKARFLFEEYFEFAPQFKAYIGTNHLPVIKESDDAIWERIKPIPFTVQIPKHERNKDLEAQLVDELPGVLAWAMRGCLAWQARKDLQEPDAVTASNATYRKEMDTIAPFLDECCTTGDPAVVKVKAPMLATAYQAWCKRTNETPLHNNAFVTNLESKGYRRERGTGNHYYWHGLGLLSTDDERY